MQGYIKILKLLAITAFVGILLMPVFNKYFHFIDNESSSENRNKAKHPTINFEKLDSFVKDYDTYYTDNFSLRNNFIKLHHQIEYNLFGLSPVPNQVVMGKQGLFYDNNNIPNYTGGNIFTNEQLQKIKAELKRRSTWAAAHNKKYYVVIVPNKMNIYPEYLPTNIIKVSHTTRYQQVVELNAPPAICVINIMPQIINHKNSGTILYQKTDGHWNELGAYYGYKAIIEKLSEDYSVLQPISINDFSIKIEKQEAGTLAKMVNLEKENSENYVKLISKNGTTTIDAKKRGYTVPVDVAEWEYEIVKQKNTAPNLKCLIIRDSFTMAMIPYLQENFKRIVFIHGQWKNKLPEDIILEENPDIIISIIHETYIGSLIGLDVDYAL